MGSFHSENHTDLAENARGAEHADHDKRAHDIDREQHNPTPFSSDTQDELHPSSKDPFLTGPDSHVEPEEHEDSIHNSSGSDERVFDETTNFTTESSPHTSEHSADEFSELEESREQECLQGSGRSHPFIPKTRSPFRNPSSVRALQLDTTPPHLLSSSQSYHYNLKLPSRNSTPRSVRSHYSNVPSPTKLSSGKKLVKEHPLVLLHVTILPTSLPYSQSIMENILPSHVLESYKLLLGKITVTVLERGILIPHPKDDFGLLEERLLESLELQVPRILECGHFHSDQAHVRQVEPSDSEGESDRDEDLCDDCGRRVKDGIFGAGRGKSRWNIKVYAANGLMRAGAWTAAWSEMERIDVEVSPWIEEDLQRQMNILKMEELRHHDAVNLQDQEDQQEPRGTSLDEERRREIYGDVEPHHEHELSKNEKMFSENVPKQGVFRDPLPHSSHRQSFSADTPLSTLLLTYLQVLMQDKKNIAIGVLIAVVVYLSLGSRPEGPRGSDLLSMGAPYHLDPRTDRPVERAIDQVADSVHSITVPRMESSDGSSQTLQLAKVDQAHVADQAQLQEAM